MGELRKLIEAVEAGKHTANTHWLDHGLHEAIPSGIFQVHQMGWIVQAYEGDLNAAKTLHDAMLTKDCYWSLSDDEDAGGYSATVYFGTWFHGEASEPSRAWLIATLKAYEAEHAKAN